MKKILSAVAALGLVAGVATTASALEFSVSGHYFVEGVYMSSGDGSGLDLNSATGEDEAGNDAYWRHEFKIKPTMKVNDKIVVKSSIYLANSNPSSAGTDGVWGSQDDLATQDGNSVDVQHLFMEYMSPVGKVRVGRTSAGMWQGDFLSNDSHGNRLMYYPNFMPENVGACVFLQKTEEGDSVEEIPGEGTTVDGDSDYYEGSVWYKTKDMVAALAYGLARDASADDQTTVKHRLKGYYNQNFSNMYVEVEFQYWNGETEKDAVAVEDVDIETLGFMADVGMNMNKLDVGMMFIYGTGDDQSDITDSTALGHLGEQFQPYNILTGANTGMMVTDLNGANSDMTKAGIISLGVHGSFAVSDALTLNSAIAYAMAEDEQVGWDDEYGWEVDLGMSYALMDNLTYQIDLGYLMTGDFFDEANTMDAEDVYTLTHRLTMEF